MKLAIVLCLALAACGTPDVAAMRAESLAMHPPTLCAPDGSCSWGLMCADDGHCYKPCGVNFACTIGWYCTEGHHLPPHDCVPLCFYADGGCS